MSLLDRLIANGNLVLFHDYRSGSAYDFSGHGNHGVFTDIIHTGQGVRFPKTTSEIFVSSSATLQITQGALIALSPKFYNEQSGVDARVFSHRDGVAAPNYEWLLENNPRQGFLSNNDSRKTGSYEGAKMLALNIGVGEAVEEYVNGVTNGVFDAPITLPGTDPDLYIGNWYTGGENNLDIILSAALIINRKLTADEHAELYAELLALKWTTKTSHKLTVPNDVIVNGDFSVWTDPTVPDGWAKGGVHGVSNYVEESVGGGCRLVSDGSNLSIYQVILMVSKTYVIKFDVTDVTLGNAKLSYGPGGSDYILITGTGSFEVPVVAGYTQFYFSRQGACDVTIDNLEVIDPTAPRKGSLWMTGYGAHESSEATTEGALENTDFRVESGSFKISRDTIENQDCKVIECVSAGICYVPTSFFNQTQAEASYGSFNFWLNRATGNNPFIAIIASEPGGSVTTGQNSYDYFFSSDGHTRFRVNTNGAVASELFRTSVGSFPNDTWSEMKTTRSGSNVFSSYVDNALMVAASGSNPSTSSTHVVSKYMVLDLDAGDKVAFADLKGDHAIVKTID